MTPEGRSQSARPAWLVPGPGPDERLGSVLERASQLYGCAPETLLEELLGALPATGWDVDGAGASVVLAMARAVGAAPHQLWAHRMLDHPRLLAPCARTAMCPRCWAEDATAGRPAGFRREWASIFRTRCVRHETPLELARPFSRSFVPQPVQAGVAVENEQGTAWLTAIDCFAVTLEAALFRGGAWPAEWRLSPRRARAVLLMVSQNLCPDDAFPPLSRVVYPASLVGFVRTPMHKTSPLRRNPWDGIRVMADPALRRASLWLVAWWTCPQWPDAWRPGWFSRDVRDLALDLPISNARRARSIADEARGSDRA